ncbi:hypothetical protein [Flavobacterium cellulosilyticum]|uniref:Uncharacterized protein n=1 Tax=Flavobacterium cellulosilyticum TaxID=2541731 RepID=A0A4R5CEZ2_9FLAO|nr:hypothetical protein [Flavobacterium cellulosilyticum]TDD95784.1 hypothetical protein E0F76_13460 [Flavobacterium cellulosilyticum]
MKAPDKNEKFDDKEDKTDESKSIDSKFLKHADEIDYFPSDKSRQQTNAEIAEQGFTVRNGHNPDEPNPNENPKKEKSNLNIEDIKNLDDDFHNDKDLEENEID